MARAHACGDDGAVIGGTAHLRGLPLGKPERSELIAFGDPYFMKQHEEAMKPVQVADASRRPRPPPTPPAAFR